MLLGIGSAATQNPDLERAGISAGILALGGIGLIIVRVLIVIGFAALGGVIGAAVLGKNRPGGTTPNTPPPPPPASYGGGAQPPAGGPGDYSGGGGGTYGSGS
jgi:hypothetical protein